MCFSKGKINYVKGNVCRENDFINEFVIYKYIYCNCLLKIMINICSINVFCKGLKWDFNLIKGNLMYFLLYFKRCIEFLKMFNCFDEY